MFTEIDIKTFLLVTPYTLSTKEIYTVWLESLLDWCTKNKQRTDRLNLIQVKQWMDSNAWGQNTRYSASCAVRGFYRWFYGDRHILTKLRLRHADPGPQRTLEEAEARKVLGYVCSNPLKDCRDRAMFAFMVDTGVRSFEVVSLLVNNLNIEKQKASVFTKGGTWQEKVFSRVTSDLLVLWLDARTVIAAVGVEQVFCSIGGLTPGRPLTTSGMRIIFRNLSKAAGLEHFSPHALRRTMATLAILNGAPTRLVQLAGGWKDIKMVERYTQKLSVKDFAGYFPMEGVNHVELTPSL